MPDIHQQYESQHIRNITAINKRIKKIYEDAIHQIQITLNTVTYKGKPFNLNDYPSLKNKVAAVIKKMQASIYAVSINSIKDSWDLSNKKNDVIIDRRLASRKLKRGVKQVLYDPNKAALDFFMRRKDKGLNLSSRVWNLLAPFKKEIEQSVGIALGTGQSAAETASQIKKYLNEPNRLFRRVRGEDGKLHLSAAARNYTP